MPIEFKGSTFTISVIYLYNNKPDIIYKALKNKINKAPYFFKNAPVVLNIGSLNSDLNWEKMKKAILDTGLRIVGVTGCINEQLKHAVLNTNIPILTEGKNNAEHSKNNVKISTKEHSLIINTPVRSGQQIYARNVDLIVTNNVSAGAELVADGNIHIYGVMRGRALAGAKGNYNCQIFFTNLIAELISIAGEYWSMEEIPKEFFYKPARLTLENGILNIQSLFV